MSRECVKDLPLLSGEVDFTNHYETIALSLGIAICFGFVDFLAEFFGRAD